jgi:anti-anti-sigma factor
MTDAHVHAVAEGGSVQIVLDGEIDMANATMVETEICDAITNRMDAASIDLSHVTYLDSAGLRVLFGLVDRLSAQQIDLELVAPLTSPARRVIDLSGLAAVATVRPETN